MAIKPKLCMIPSGVGTDTLYSVLPTDGTGDFDFDRNLNTATRINKDGLIEMVNVDVPRLNYPLIDGVVSGCPSLLLEPTRTNLLTHSEGFVTDWNNTNITINSNSNISPDGSLNGTKFIPNTTSGQHYLDRNGVTVNSNASASIFAKKGEYKRFAIRSYFTGANAIFDVENGVIVLTSSVTAKIENYGNGWFRCSLNETLDANYGYGVFVMESDSTNPLDNYTGNNVDGMYFYGAMLEQGSFVSSYIPTENGIATRSAETCNNAGDVNTFNDSEGVLMVEASTLVNGADGRITISDNSISNRVSIEWDALANTIKGFMGGDGFIETDNYNQTNTLKIALHYKVSDFRMFINGFYVAQDVTASAQVNLNTLSFDNATGSNPFYGNTKQIQYFDTALTDTDLEELTSWSSFNEMANAQLYTII